MSGKPSEPFSAKATAYATVFMAVLTAVLAWGAIRNIDVLKEQLREARESDGRQTRAWMVVYATSYGVATDAQKMRHASAKVTLKNTGNSPAFHVHITRCGEVRTSEPDSNNLIGTNCIENEVGIVGKDVPIPLNSFDPNFEVPTAGIALPRHFYSWGRVSYQVMPDQSTHLSTFCLQDADKQLGPCSKGNEAN